VVESEEEKKKEMAKKKARREVIRREDSSSIDPRVDVSEIGRKWETSTLKTVAVIQARLNSRRFPGKVLADLCGKPVLQWVIERCRQAAHVDEVIVATCEPGGETIAGRCRHRDVPYLVYPSEQDVLGRVLLAAETAEADYVVRVCADNPLVDPRGIDQLVRAIVDHPRYKRQYDYAGYLWEPGKPAIMVPTGRLAGVVAVDALRRAHGEARSASYLREHVTMWFYLHPEQYALRWVELPEWFTPAMRRQYLAIDTREDLERVAEVVGSGER